MLSTTREFVHPINSAKEQRSSPPSLRAARLSKLIPSVEPEGACSSLRSSSYDQMQRIARNTDVAAFDQLINCHRVTCMKRALLIMRNRSDAEDAVQSGFRKAFQHRDQFQGTGTFAAWLSRIVENECLMRIREERSVRVVSLDNPTESNIRLELVGPNTNPEDELGRKEVVEVLRKEMLRMPPLFRNIVLLHDSEQLPMPDVAKRLGVSIPAAKSRLQRARRELRSRIGKHCGRKGPGTLLEKAIYGRTAYARAS
jgi:RNA polymerase sigma-70 factor (ECF subfamily)